MEFLQMACTVPKEKDVDLAVKSLKELGALTMTKKSCTRNPFKHIVDVDDEEPVQAGVTFSLESENLSLWLTSKKLNNLDLKDGELTPMGRLMSCLPLELPLSRMIYIGSCMGLAEEAIIIAATSETQIWKDFHRDTFLFEQNALGSVQDRLSK